MKKMIGLLLLVVLVCLAVSPVLAESPVGIWYINAIQAGEVMLNASIMDFTVIFRKNGNLLTITNGNEVEGKWSQKGDRIIFFSN